MSVPFRGYLHLLRLPVYWSPRLWQHLHLILTGLHPSSFFVQQNRRTFSPQSFRECRTLAGFIRTVNPDVIHFDTAKARALGLLPFLYSRFRNRVIITIHDPLPHSGEFNWRNILVRKGFFPLAARFVFYSDFSENLFRKAFPAYSRKTTAISMHPYSFYRSYRKGSQPERTSILFFGRISPYKGVDILLKAIPKVLEKYPRENFVIAGAKGESYEPDRELVAACGTNLDMRLRHIQNDDLVEMITEAKMVVCPYRDATQSGVLMTAYALNTGVVASNVGAFPEYVKEGENGLMYESGDADALASAIIESLDQGRYESWSSRLSLNGQAGGWQNETARLLKVYKSALEK